MGKISGLVRKVADDYDVLSLYRIADSIDDEMVELPRDANDKPIHLGDTVYDGSGREWTVKGIGYHDYQPSETKRYIPSVSIDLSRTDEHGCCIGINGCSSEEYSHEFTDSLRDMASDLSNAADEIRNGKGVSLGLICELHDRILKYAEEHDPR